MSKLQSPAPTISWPLDARPTVRTAGLFALHAEGFEYTYRAQFHALHLHEYTGVVRQGDRDYTLAPGTITLSPAGFDSSYDLPRPGVHWCIHFNPCSADTKGPKLALPLARPAQGQLGEAVARFAHIARLHATAARSSGPNRALLQAAASLALQELLVWFGLLGKPDASVAIAQDDDGIERVLDFIDRNLHRPMRAAELATHAGLSQNYLARLFRRRTGQALPRYVLTRRIAAARLLLDTTNLPIKHVAVRIGLPDAHHFNKQFRAIVGMSPMRYRANEPRQKGRGG